MARDKNQNINNEAAKKMNKLSRKTAIQRLIAVLALAGLLHVSACGKYEQVTEKLDFLKYEYFTCDVASVADAEHFVCQTPAMDMQKIRLIGISVPEEREDEAKKFSESVLRRGTLVRVEPERNQKVEDGSIDAYVFVPGGKMLNVLLIENGYATLVKNEVGEKYIKQFEEAAGKADAERNETREKRPWLRQ